MREKLKMGNTMTTGIFTSGSATLRLINIVFVLYLLVGSTNALSAESQITESVNDTNIKWLVFSSSKYEFERGLVRKKEHVHYGDLKYGGKIYIALADLKGDGSNEIISYIDIWSFCGKIGCPFNIYEKHNKTLTSLLPRGPNFGGGFPIFIDIDQTGHQKVLGILQHKTKGWYGIVLEGPTVWKWNGKNYDVEK